MLTFGSGVFVHPDARLDVANGHIGDRTRIEKGALIQGSNIYIGNESFVDEGSIIGGGSCYDEQAFIFTGDWFHLGKQGQVNTARGVILGH